MSDGSKEQTQKTEPWTPATDDRRKVSEKVGRFEIRDRLGSGGFGSVYKAFDTELQREVALKVPHPGALETEADVERFLREARAAAKLQHSAIVPVFDAGEHGDTRYIASAFINGRSLAEARNDYRNEPMKVAELVMQLADALAYAHDSDVIHRDVKPANVMIDHKGRPFLMDFGLAFSHESSQRLTTAGALVGTPSYLSPEQVETANDKPAPSNDQYSLGVLMYELLTGELPFTGTLASVVYKHINQPPRPPREIKQNVPPSLQRICLRMLEKRPEDRFPDCHAAAAELRRALANEETAGPTTPNRRTVGLTVGSLLLIAALVTSYWLGKRPGTSAPGGTSSPAPAVAADPQKSDLVSVNAPTIDATVLPPRRIDELGLDLVPIRAGTFMMGSRPDEKNRKTGEVYHKVTITRPFWIGRTEITKAQWWAVIKDSPADFDGDDSVAVGWIGWTRAKEFCHLLTQLYGDDIPAGYEYRLPTNAEWEYCCRAGTDTAFSFGDDSSALAEHAWFNKTTDGRQQRSVGQLKPNAWGLYDMHGNIYEWVLDLEHAYSSEPQVDPFHPKGKRNILRGGSFYHGHLHCRSALQMWADRGTQANTFGLRVVLAPEIRQ